MLINSKYPGNVSASVPVMSFASAKSSETHSDQALVRPGLFASASPRRWGSSMGGWDGGFSAVSKSEQVSERVTLLGPYIFFWTSPRDFFFFQGSVFWLPFRLLLVFLKEAC